MAFVLQTLKLFTISLVLTGLVADQQLDLGHRRTFKQKSFVQCHNPCSGMAYVQTRYLSSRAEEMGEIFLQQSLAQIGFVTQCPWGTGSHLSVVVASRDESSSKALCKMGK